ncbi:MAG: protein kinase [Acidobacteria bacterium]|nr:protein kinase [Acidobacteriota bacterium]
MASQETNIDRLLKARAELDEALRQYKTSLAVLFTDIVGSTSYFDRYGDTAGLALLRRHADLAGDLIQQGGGRVVKTIGDSVLADFPDAASAVRAAVEIQRRQAELNETLADFERFHVRIGIHCGSVFRSSADVFGDVVNLAARITKRTGPSQILVSRPVQEALSGLSEFPCNWIGKVFVEGKPEKEDIFEVLWTNAEAYAEARRLAQAVILLQKGQDALARGEAPPAGKYLEDILTPPGSPLSLLGDRYEVLGEVARGGMGIVYKAREKETGDIVALKVLKPEVADDASVMERFRNEVRLARKITHKNVCRIYEFNRIEGLAYISMEFVEGESLRRVLRRFRTLSLRNALQVMEQVCAGLQEAHSQSVVHRDLKPENIMLDPAGNVKLMDFGIARSLFALGHTATFIGTPAYMAPEQAEGQAFIDYRADIYSLGLILYELFTGTPAFRGESPVEVALKQVREMPARPRELEPTLPIELENIIMRAIEKDPALRFQSASKLHSALREVVAALAPETPVPAPSAPLLVRSRLSALLTRTNLLGVAAVAALLLVGTLMQQPRSALDSSDSEASALFSNPDARPVSRPGPVTSELSAGFYLRTGSFGKEPEAIEQANRLQRLGYSPWVVPRRRARDFLRRSYEVRVGPYAKPETADSQKQRLERQGFSNLSVVEEKAAP